MDDSMSVDARTGPFLAAVAFFMTGGIAALVSANIRAAKFVFYNGSEWFLPLYLLAGSLLLAGFSAMSLILSLGPPEPPRSPTTASGTGTPTPERNAWYKYERIVEARATFFLSLPFFLLGLVVTIFALTMPDAEHAYPFSWKVSGVGAFVVLVLTFAAGNDRARIESLGNGTEDDATTFRKLAVSFAAFAFLSLFAAGLPGYWPPVGVSFLSFLPIGWACLFLKKRRRSADVNSGRVLDKLHPYYLLAMQGVAVTIGLIPLLRPLLIGVSLGPLVILEGSRLWFGYTGTTAKDYWRAREQPKT
jgi:hypothetical protein